MRTFGRYLYISDYEHGRVRVVDTVTGLIKTVAGTGSPGFNGDGIPATTATLSGPVGLAVNSSNANDSTLFIADAKNDRIRIVK